MCEGPRPFIPVENVVRVDAMYTGPGGTCENVYHVMMNGPFTAADLNEVLNIFEAWENSNGKQHRSNGYSLTRLIGTDLTVAESFRIDRIVSPAIVGAVNSSPLPSHCTLAVAFKSGLGGRSRNGRAYWIGLGENQVIGDDVIVQEVAGIVLAYTALRDQLNVEDRNLAVVSYCSNNVWRAAGLATPVTTFFTDGVVDSQRRRLKSRGS